MAFELACQKFQCVILRELQVARTTFTSFALLHCNVSRSLRDFPSSSSRRRVNIEMLRVFTAVMKHVGLPSCVAIPPAWDPPSHVDLQSNDDSAW